MKRAKRKEDEEVVLEDPKRSRIETDVTAQKREIRSLIMAIRPSFAPIWHGFGLSEVTWGAVKA